MYLTRVRYNPPMATPPASGPHKNPNQQSSYHSKKYYTRHPELQRPPKAQPAAEPGGGDTPSLVIFLRFVGLVFILGGLALIVVPTLYWWGMPVVQIGFAAAIVEVYTDPAFRKKGKPLVVALSLVCLCFWAVFNHQFVFVDGGISPTAYSVVSGYYPKGTKIAGIEWDDRLTELHVGLTNPTDDALSDVDVVILPDHRTYRAAILEAPSNCELKDMPSRVQSGVATSVHGGNTTITSVPVGPKLETHDNQGDVFTTLVTDAGYRLMCSKIPPHLTVEVVFALASVLPQFDKQPPQPKNDEKWSMYIAEVGGVSTLFDMFGPRPETSTIAVSGDYTRRFKPIHIDTGARVERGS